MPEVKIDLSRGEVPGDRLLVKRLAPESSIGSIILPEDAQRERTLCTVEKLGSGIMLNLFDPMLGPHLGDQVIVSRACLVAGAMPELGADFAIIDQNNVLFILHPENAKQEPQP
jgi:co-chaperonin GroES (HSP10)